MSGDAMAFASSLDTVTAGVGWAEDDYPCVVMRDIPGAAWCYPSVTHDAHWLSTHTLACLNL